MQLTEHFTLEEFTHSDVALRLGIKNEPNILTISNLIETAKLMEAVRHLLGDRPINVHSAYRCPELNKRIGGSATSVHPLGLACDFDCAEFGTPVVIAQTIHDSIKQLPLFDQCILEYGWVHMGLAYPGTVQRAMFLTKKSAAAPYLQGIVA